MPVTQDMITELINCLIKDEVALNPTFKVSHFKRQGRAADFNRQASEKNEAYARIRYEGLSLHVLFQQCCEAYESLKTRNVDIDFALGEHAWLAPYLPLFNSEMFQRVMQQHRTDYVYSDESEICLQSMVVFMLSYHSNPALVTENPAQCENIANGWLQALLTFNDIKKPELKTHIENWHDNPFCSTERNLKFMQFCNESYYKISKQFAAIFNTSKWTSRVIAFDEINKVLFKVLQDHEIINSHAFMDAVQRLQSINQNQAQFTRIEIAETIATAVPSDEHDSSIAVAELITPQSDPVIVIASSEEEERIRQAGADLIRSGLARLNFLAEANRHHATHDSEQELNSCLTQ